MCGLLEKCLQDSFVLNSPETFFAKCQNSGIGFGRLQVCLDDSSLDLPSHRVHPSNLLRSRSPHGCFARRPLGHRIGHLIAKNDRHVVMLGLDVGNVNMRTLPLHCKCSLPRFEGTGQSPPKVRVAALPKTRYGPTPILPFLEDLVVRDVDHIASRALSCHNACHELRPAHSIGFALTKRAHPTACGLETVHEPLTVAFPDVQGLPKTV